MGLWSWLIGKGDTPTPLTEKDIEVDKVLRESEAVQAEAEEMLNEVHRDLAGLRVEFGIRRDRSEMARAMVRARDRMIEGQAR